MKASITKLVFILVIINLYTPVKIQSDTWATPFTIWYFSDNNEYCVEVIPARLYYDIKRPDSLEFDLYFTSVKKDNPCVAICYKLGSDGIYHNIWSSKLDNNTAPVNVLVHNSGKYLVTIDNWGSTGYGDNVVVVYDETGKLLYKYSLEELLSEKRISKIIKSVSSRGWGSIHAIDEENNELVLALSTSSQKLFSLWEFEDNELRIDLPSGTIKDHQTNFNEIVNSYEEPCYDDIYCPVARFLYYKTSNPSEGVKWRYSKIKFSNDEFTNIKSVFNAYHYSININLATAYTEYGREIYWLVDRNNKQYFLLEAGSEINQSHTFPLIIKLPDGKEVYPINTGGRSFEDALQKAAVRFIKELQPISQNSIFPKAEEYQPRIYMESIAIDLVVGDTLPSLTDGERTYIDLTR